MTKAMRFELNYGKCPPTGSKLRFLMENVWKSNSTSIPREQKETAFSSTRTLCYLYSVGTPVHQWPNSQTYQSYTGLLNSTFIWISVRTFNTPNACVICLKIRVRVVKLPQSL
nr:c289.2 [Tranosema rostrale ichnovirus]